MADLSVLIRLHKHELDEKRRALAELYGAMAALERQRRELERSFELEKAAVAKAGDIHYTFAGYVETVKAQREKIDRVEEGLEKQIELARDALMDSFAELKKYEMTQEERARLEEEERRFREGRDMDAIGIEGFMRRERD